MKITGPKIAGLLLFVVALSPIAFGQAAGQPFTSTVPSDVLKGFQDASKFWTLGMIDYAKSLFWMLAFADFVWSAASLVLEGADFHAWTAAIIRKVIFVGFWWTVLVWSNEWIPSIIDSFAAMGTKASGVQSLAPSAIFGQGLQVAAALVDAGTSLDVLVLGGFSGSLVMVAAAFIVALSYVIVVLAYVVTWVEAYLVMSVGYIFLGFGGSRWTSEYASKYISLAVGIGTKMLLLYCLIAAGSKLGVAWTDEATNVFKNAGRPLMVYFDVAAGALLFCLCVWHIPRLFQSVFGGAPNMGHGEVIAATVGLTLTAARLSSVAASLRGGAAVAGSAGSSGSGSYAAAAASSVTQQVAAVRAASVAVAPPAASNGAGHTKTN